MAVRNKKFGIVCLIFQVAFLVLFAVFIEYDDSAHANPKHAGDGESRHKRAGDPSVDHHGNAETPAGKNMLWDFYPSKQ